MKAVAEQLLARHGVLTRDAVAYEEVPGGFAAVYPVLRALEEAGRIRRGYFVTGRGGLQFALPGALERLRSGGGREEPRAVALAATDPANPYGACLPWPRMEGTRLRRAAGSHVVLVDGALTAFVGRRGRDVVTLLPDDEPSRTAVARAAARALAAWCARTGRAALGWAGGPGPTLAEGPLAPYLVEAGFARSGPGFRLSTVDPDRLPPSEGGGPAASGG
jgi:ATP-dependent Lhr-like helicase